MNKEYIVTELKKLGVTEGMALEVHSSLSSFGYVEGGAQTVIAALKECVGEEGSIFMPALRLSPDLPITEADRKLGITCKIEILPENRTKSAMGVIADTFRMEKGTITGEGIMQTSGWGKHAVEAAKGGLDYVLHHGGKALLLGVDIYKLTAMHYVECYMPEDIGAIFAPSEKVNQIYPPDKWFIETGHPPIKAWYTIQKMAYEKGIITDGKIGDCKVMFFDVWDVVQLYEKELKTNPYKLYGIVRD
ncbi:AAC(3) family N-acetyltransferase [Anaerosporobacter faecicola]|uniref:AAC(3) family N-acetyltransferase n=1 Tax=Anaerosporobacter faecicola TaxID=2718714 RepID=UPI00143A0C37|nr:AAC(3) family N-acetyltransferase [Anaerosporobacter faecicola]